MAVVTLTLLAGLPCLLLTAAAQDRASSVWRAVQAADSADAMPPYDATPIYRDIYGRISWSGWEWLTRNTQDSVMAGLPIYDAMNRRSLVRNVRAHVNRIYLLAWSVQRFTSYLRWGESAHRDSVTTTSLSTLVAASYADTAGRQFWGVFLFSRAEGRTEWACSQQLGFARFNRRPANDDIYSYVAQQYYGVGSASCPAFFCAIGFLATDVGESIDGAVRINTWKSVTGEAPTIFFPNGK
ncbi:MAG TPA: hypothetical protein VHI13_07450 [Candidatus Kapabacteria bacterium]|nr:hypothetical protein [Candidatus Kapabacteria bacterium]